MPVFTAGTAAVALGLFDLLKVKVELAYLGSAVVAVQCLFVWLNTRDAQRVPPEQGTPMSVV